MTFYASEEARKKAVLAVFDSKSGNGWEQKNEGR
jgi:hypothetical protein